MKKNSSEETLVISFRVSESFVKKINTFAKERLDEAGKKLSTSKAARMLVFKGLESSINSNISESEIQKRTKK